MGLVVFVLIQFIPFSITNPPEKTEILWDSPQTQALFKRACADCHSHQTIWPWYSHIAPVSWFTRQHVRDGREAFNISEETDFDIDEIRYQIRKNKMPLPRYLWMHPEAKLSEDEKEALIQGLQKTLE